MWTAVVKFLFGTPMGRGVLMGGSIVIGIALGWWAFSSHYDAAGYARCQGEQQKAINDANKAQADKNAASNVVSSEVGKTTADATRDVIDKADTKSNEAKEKITDVYRDPPRTAPVAFGSCVHPVDPRVQQEIDEAIRSAAGGP